MQELGHTRTLDRGQSRAAVQLVTVCTACAGSGAAQDPFYYDWQGRRFDIYRCPSCTHQFVHPPVTAADQAAIYADQYFGREGDWVVGVWRESYLEAEAKLRDEAREVLALLPPPPGRLLDIGCAGGVFLDAARIQGYEVAGIEINTSMAEHARAQFGLRVVNARIEDVPDRQWSTPFDVVTVLDCLEHVPEPLAALQKMARWVRPGGTVLIRGPLSNSPVAHAKEVIRRVIRRRKQLPGYPLDANMFNKRSLGTMLHASGFEVVAWPGESHDFSNLVARKR